MKSAAQIPEKIGPNPDYERGLSVCGKPGIEFASAGSAVGLVSLFATQAFAMLFIIPAAVYFILRNTFAAPLWVAAMVTVLTGLPIVGAGIWMLLRVNRGNQKQGVFFSNQSDSRYRVRVVIPPKRRSDRMMRWAGVASGSGEEDAAEIEPTNLEMIRGGFDPLIVRPYFGVRRDRWFWWTAVVCGLLIAGGLIMGLSMLMGGWRGVVSSSGITGYALMGAVIVAGLVSAEFMWPVYIRLVPGRLDIFRYGVLGSGVPKVESFDLRKTGVCVDFGSYIVAIEPPRPVGEPLPKLVQAKRWPHGQTFPDDYQPVYLCAALVPGRREFAQRVIQAARTDEPTPPVSDVELTG